MNQVERLELHRRGKPSVSKHMAANDVWLRDLLLRLDGDGDKAAADTIAWLIWWSDLHAERERLLLQNKREKIEGLEEKIENAHQTASETQPSWKHRCYRIMSALGLDYGDPDWMMPDERKKVEELEATLADYRNPEARCKERHEHLHAGGKPTGPEIPPYTEDEKRVVDYLVELTGVGGGDDPIGFLIASHGSLRERILELQKAVEVENINSHGFQRLYHKQLKRAEAVEYELRRLKETIANRPDYEKLWAEQAQIAEEMDPAARLGRLFAAYIKAREENPTSEQSTKLWFEALRLAKELE